MSFLSCCKSESPSGKGIKEIVISSLCSFLPRLFVYRHFLPKVSFLKIILSTASESAVNLNIFRNFFHRLWCLFGELEFQDAILKGSFDILVF